MDIMDIKVAESRQSDFLALERPLPLGPIAN